MNPIVQQQAGMQVHADLQPDPLDVVTMTTAYLAAMSLQTPHGPGGPATPGGPAAQPASITCHQVTPVDQQLLAAMQNSAMQQSSLQAHLSVCPQTSVFPFSPSGTLAIHQDQQSPIRQSLEQQSLEQQPLMMAQYQAFKHASSSENAFHYDAQNQKMNSGQVDIWHGFGKSRVPPGTYVTPVSQYVLANELSALIGIAGRRV
jgi:hypothetical protein